MSTIAGAFDETILLDIRAKADEIMFDDRIKQQFIPKIEAWNAIKAAQTATVLPALGRTKKVGVDVIWENYCDIDDTDNTGCTICGTKSSTNLQNYDVTWEKVVMLNFDENDFIDNEFLVNESIPKGILRAEKQLAEAFIQYAVAQIDGFSGVNTVGTLGKGTVSGTDTYIAGTDWNASLVAYLQYVAIQNRFTTPIMLSGRNLWEQMYVAVANAANADGKGTQALYGDLDMYFDLFNIDSVLTPDYKTFMISQGALAVGNRYFNPTTTPEDVRDFWRWHQPSRFLPGFELDMFYQPSCYGDDDLIKHCFKVKLQADIWNNPEGCEANNTGVLSFVCGSAS